MFGDGEERKETNYQKLSKSGNFIQSIMCGVYVKHFVVKWRHLQCFTTYHVWMYEVKWLRGIDFCKNARSGRMYKVSLLIHKKAVDST